MPYLGSIIPAFDPSTAVSLQTDAERFSGNGSTTIFTLSRTVSTAVDVDVYVENVKQEPTTAYSAAGTTLTFTAAPSVGTNNIYVLYRGSAVSNYAYVPDGSITYAKMANNVRQFTTDLFTANGTGQTFTLTDTPADANTLIVTVDGVFQASPNNYTISGSTLTLTSAPSAGANVSIRNLGFRTTTTVNTLLAGTVTATELATGAVTSGKLGSNLTLTGNTTVSNLSFTGSNNRIQADWTNATFAYRTSFQTSNTNSSTGIYALPNGSNTSASWQAVNSSDPTNASKILIAAGASDMQLVSGINGSGSYLPLTFWNNGAEKMRLDANGNVGIGTATANSTLDIKGNLRLTGATSGYVAFAPAAAAGSTTYVLPSADGSSGQYLSTSGTGTLSWGTVTSTPIPSMNVFTSGNGRWTIPAGITKVRVTVVGGGGNGGGGGGQNGGGGGGGGTSIKVYTNLTPSSNITYNVGAAGATSGVSNGSQTIVAITATGGASGAGGDGYQFGGAGGVGSGGDLNIGGSDGCNTDAGTASGGTSYLGGSGRASNGTGKAYGGGGGGGGPGSSNAGAAGVVIFEY
jgi:hypothetical protein